MSKMELKKCCQSPNFIVTKMFRTGEASDIVISCSNTKCKSPLEIIVRTDSENISISGGK